MQSDRAYYLTQKYIQTIDADTALSLISGDLRYRTSDYFSLRGDPVMKQSVFEEQLGNLRKGKNLPENRNWYWSSEDDKKLVELFNKPTGISEIALILGRSEISIINRLRLKGLLKPQSRRRVVSEDGYEKKCHCPGCTCDDCTYCGVSGRTSGIHKTA